MVGEGPGEGDGLQGSVTMAVVDNAANKRGAVRRSSKRGQQEGAAGMHREPAHRLLLRNNRKNCVRLGRYDQEEVSS